MAGLVALASFDAGVYANAARGAEGRLERTAEPVMLVGTAAALLFALVAGGTLSAVVAVASLWARAGWDALHFGDGNVLSIALPRDYPLFAFIAKAAAGLLFLVLAFHP